MLPSARRPVILQVLPALESGGVERGTLEMVEAIAQAGGMPLVASIGGRLSPRVEYLGGRHIKIDMRSKNPIAILRASRKLAALIEAEGVDLVHARSRAPAWAARLACRKRAHFVTTWHGVHSENFPGKKSYNRVLASGERVIAISGYIGERLARDYRVGPDRLRIIPRGADTRQFDPAVVRGDRVQALVDAWDLPDGAAVVLMPGRITAWKGQGLLLDALAEMEKKHLTSRHWVCVLAGSSDERKAQGEALNAQAQRLGLAGSLRFAGHCADMPAALALADVVVVPSLRPEPFGRVVVEAQAMARPVIVAAHGAAVETVIPGETGLAVRPGDVAALADALAAVLEAPAEALEALGARARESVLAQYTTHAMQQATLAVYDELLGTQLAAVHEPEAFETV